MSDVINLADVRARRQQAADEQRLEIAARLMAEAVKSAGPAATRRVAAALLRRPV